MGAGPSLPERVLPLIPPTFKHISIADKCGSPDHIETLKKAEWYNLKSFGRGPIHPLLQQKIFSNVDIMRSDVMAFFDHPVTDDFYQRLRPALRLATILLERGRSFFATIVLGKIFTHFDDDEHPWLALKPVLFDELTNAEKAKYHETIDNLAERTRICWIPGRAQGCDYTYGLADIAYLPFLSQLDSRIIHRLAVSDEIWQAFGGPAWMDKSLEQKYYLSLLLAVTLVHEICHLLWRNRNIRDDLDHIHYDEDGGISCRDEPIIVPLYNKELGETWEKLQMGGHTFAGSRTRVHPNGVANYAGDSPPQDTGCFTDDRFSDFNDINGIILAGRLPLQGLSLDSVARLFMKTTWCNETQMNKQIPLYIYRYEVPPSSDTLCNAKNYLCEHMRRNEPSMPWIWGSKKGKRASLSSATKGLPARMEMVNAAEAIRHPRARYDKARIPKSRATILDDQRSFLSIPAYNAAQLPDTYTFGTEDDLIRTFEAKTCVALWTVARLDISALPEVITTKCKKLGLCEAHQESQSNSPPQESSAGSPARVLGPFSQAESDLDTDREMASSDADSNFDPDSEMSDAISDSESDTDTIKPNVPIDDDSDYYTAVGNPSDFESSDSSSDEQDSAEWYTNEMAYLKSRWSVGEEIAEKKAKFPTTSKWFWK